MHIVSSRHFNSGYYLYIKSATDETPMIHTQSMHFSEMMNLAENITFKVFKSNSVALYNEILEMESVASKLVKTLSPDYIKNLRFEHQAYIGINCNNDSWECLRPNYCTENKPTMYLKANTKSVRAYDLEGNDIPLYQLQPGYYQFVIKANTIYMGQHKVEHHIGNLQLRITQIRYSTYPFDSNNLNIVEPTDVSCIQPNDNIQDTFDEKPFNIAKKLIKPLIQSDCNPTTYLPLPPTPNSSAFTRQPEWEPFKFMDESTSTKTSRKAPYWKPASITENEPHMRERHSKDLPNGLPCSLPSGFSNDMYTTPQNSPNSITTEPSHSPIIKPPALKKIRKMKVIGNGQ